MVTCTKMTNLNTIKIVVLGSKRSGKSALTVRYLTKRFIGEYRSNVDLLYKQTIVVDGITSAIEILDMSRWTNDDSFPLEQIRWADALIIVYNICDGASFDDVHALLDRNEKLIGSTSNHTRPMALLGNKRDLEHGRTVSLDAGRQLALRHGCFFSEVSAAESYQSVCAAFGELIREARTTTLTSTTTSNNSTSMQRRKLSMFAVSKMIGAIIGHGRNNSSKGLLSSHQQIQNNNNNIKVNNNNKKKKRPSLSL